MNLSTGQIEAGRSHRSLADLYVWLEGIALLLAAPFLFFPDFFPVATAGAMLLLGIVWLFSVYANPPLPTPFNFVLVLWGIVLIVGILVSADPLETLPKATGVILGLAVWRFIVMAVRSRRRIGLAVAIFLLLGIGLSLVGIASLQGLPKIPFLVQINPFQAQGASGLGGHVNQVAGLICVYLPLLFSLSIAPPDGRSRRLRIALFFATLLATAILLLTQSRGGWVALTAGLFVLLVLWSLVLPPSPQRRALRLAAVVIVLVGLAVVVWIGPGTLLDLWLNPPNETIVGTLRTLNYRRTLWPWAVATIADFPFTGVGLGAFGKVVFRLYPLPMNPNVEVSHAHNIYLQTALDVGLPGLVVYLAILLVAAAVGWQIARRDNGLRPVSLGLMAGLAALQVYGLTDAQVLGSKPGIIFWFALGLLAAMHRTVRSSD